MSPEALLAGLFLYLGLLFLLARLGEERGGRLFQSPWTYTLSLGVYATAWTFFGSAGGLSPFALPAGKPPGVVLRSMATLLRQAFIGRRARPIKTSWLTAKAASQKRVPSLNP